MELPAPTMSCELRTRMQWTHVETFGPMENEVCVVVIGNANHNAYTFRRMMLAAHKQTFCKPCSFLTYDYNHACGFGQGLEVYALQLEDVLCDVPRCRRLYAVTYGFGCAVLMQYERGQRARSFAAVACYYPHPSQYLSKSYTWLKRRWCPQCPQCLPGLLCFRTLAKAHLPSTRLPSVLFPTVVADVRQLWKRRKQSKQSKRRTKRKGPLKAITHKQLYTDLETDVETDAETDAETDVAATSWFVIEDPRVSTVGHKAAKHLNADYRPMVSNCPMNAHVDVCMYPNVFGLVVATLLTCSQTL